MYIIYEFYFPAAGARRVWRPKWDATHDCVRPYLT
jgi:hypothetical protein